jgi:hypothetical protein
MKRGMIRPLMLLALTSSGAASGQSAPRSADLGRPSLSLQSVVAKVGPAVVQVRSVDTDRYREERLVALLS